MDAAAEQAAADALVGCCVGISYSRVGRRRLVPLSLTTLSAPFPNPPPPTSSPESPLSIPDELQSWTSESRPLGRAGEGRPGVRLQGLRAAPGEGRRRRLYGALLVGENLRGSCLRLNFKPSPALPLARAPPILVAIRVLPSRPSESSHQSSHRSSRPSMALGDGGSIGRGVGASGGRRVGGPAGRGAVPALLRARSPRRSGSGGRRRPPLRRLGPASESGLLRAGCAGKLEARKLLLLLPVLVLVLVVVVVCCCCCC